MRISYNWLKWYIPEIPDPKKLEDVFTFHVCEVEEVVSTEKDTLFDIKILPDRAGDLLSHLGVARELSGLLGIPFVDPTPHYKIPEAQKTTLDIQLESPDCIRYMGRIVRNFKVGPSPAWVVEHLQSIGERSINNIVDASNLVMFNCGQPTHAFDLQKLTTEKIIIKNADTELEFPVVGSEQLVAKVKEGDLLICDTDKPLALAGVKGGVNSGISIDAPYMTDVLIEVANFEPSRIRKTGQRLGIYSDARKRFENNVPIDLASYAMREFSSLLLEMCPDATFEEIVDVGQKEQEKKTVSFTTDILNEKLGLTLTPADIASILQKYQYGYVEEQGNFVVHVPYYRQDITGIHDMVEEIGRVYGYDKVVPQVPLFPQDQKHDETYIAIEAVKKHCIENGYSEVMTYSFVKKGDLVVAHGPKGKDALRTNLTDGLKESFEKNRLNAPLLGLTDVKVFEVGTVFTNEGESIHVATATKKGVEEMTLDEFVSKNNINFTTLELDKLSTRNENRFVIWSDYPFIFRDVSFWSNRELTLEDFQNMMKDVLSSLCVKGPYLVDNFSKDGKYSYAFRFVFQSYEKTLTDEDFTGEWNSILELIQKEGFEIR